MCKKPESKYDDYDFSQSLQHDFNCQECKYKYNVKPPTNYEPLILTTMILILMAILLF